MCFLIVWLKDGPIGLLIDEPVLVEIAHVGEGLQVTVAAGLFPHLQIFERFSVKSSLIERSEAVERFIVFFAVGLFVVVDCFLEVFIDDGAFLVQNSSNPLGVRQLLD